MFIFQTYFPNFFELGILLISENTGTDCVPFFFKNTFRKFAVYKINILESLIVLYTSNKQRIKKIFK